MKTNLETNTIVDRILTSYRDVENVLISEAEIQNYIQSVGFLEDVLRFSKTAFVVVAYPQFTYPYVSSNLKEVMGWDAERFKKGGSAFGVKQWHPKDLEMQEKIHPDMVKFFSALPDEEKSRYKFAFTSRILREDGGCNMILQNNFFLKWDSMGKPLLKLMTLTDISLYKEDNNIVFYITRLNDRGESEVIAQQTFPESNITLSKRELEVIRYISSGLSSSEIGLALNISEHTVKVHKKNILKKMGCSNTAQVNALASLYGLIKADHHHSINTSYTDNYD